MKKQLSYTSAVAVAALPAATAALKGVTVWLTTDDKPYWCNGSSWVDLSAGGAGGGAVIVQDEGVQKTSAVALINFTGAGVSVTNSGNDVTVDISGSGGTAPTLGLIAGAFGGSVPFL